MRIKIIIIIIFCGNVLYKVNRILVDYFDFQNLFGFGRISQIFIIFLDIDVIQMCGI